MNEDSLELDLSLVLGGLEQTKAYTAALKALASAQGAVARQADKANQALAQAKAITANAVASIPGAVASGGGQMQLTLPAAPRAPRAQPNAATLDYRALYSSRINLPGGANPLVGRTLDAMIGPQATKAVLGGLAPAMRLLGPFAAALMLAKDGLHALYSAASESAAITNRLTSSQASAGGSIADNARLSLLGGNAGAARSFQDRITSDPLAMSAAGSVGIHNQPGSYGNLNFAKQYTDAIDRVSKIADASLRQRLALRLGIEQEVAKYSLMGEEAQKRIKAQAAITGQINDPRAQQSAAEFEAAQTQMSQAWDNVKTAFGQLFSDDVTGVLNELADGANSLAKWLQGMRPSNKRYTTPLGALTGGLLGDAGYDAPSASKQSPLTANTLAMQANTEALSRLNSNIGGGQRTREALPGPLRGQFLHDAMMTRQLRLGALG